MRQVRATLFGVVYTCDLLLFNQRQGVLPYPRFWASTKPFNTPLGPYLLKWILTVIVIVAPPAGDAFNFSKSLSLYLSQIPSLMKLLSR